MPQTRNIAWLKPFCGYFWYVSWTVFPFKAKGLMQKLEKTLILGVGQCLLFPWTLFKII